MGNLFLIFTAIAFSFLFYFSFSSTPVCAEECGPTYKQLLDAQTKTPNPDEWVHSTVTNPDIVEESVTLVIAGPTGIETYTYYDITRGEAQAKAEALCPEGGSVGINAQGTTIGTVSKQSGGSGGGGGGGGIAGVILIITPSLSETTPTYTVVGGTGGVGGAAGASVGDGRASAAGASGGAGASGLVIKLT